MVFEQLDTLKQQYTDKYVVVDAARPELARFRDVVGQVKTVNMSGRALVEFLDYHVNIGWYDIDPAFLKLVDKPAPKPKETEAKKAAPTKPAAEAPAKSQAAAKPQAATTAPAAGVKMSVADILAAARGGKAAAPAKTPAAPAAEAASPKAPAAKPAAGGKLSTADILAAARGGKAAAPAKPQAAAKPQAEETPAEEPVAEEPVVEKPPAPAKAANAAEKVDRSKMTVDEMLAWCRAHDTK